ncbi:PorP/SprF family type IX secretion system membrane protein [Marinoscillum furvescens]|uniref:Type IX secretion system PorP/SprF family membrane protein n=1 Tax=Marinoscillum furvescens DSM 4134 TaxID=1122208 RepID=A0A3D9L736_MARFU|nr:type IX secretion system membrane protein PorP/SprF [Marinoscillum furvescens]REE02125.1 type IX secretion system PorP/SprF family membrane protein [Marinoscillum furvescens DSM 4134]
MRQFLWILLVGWLPLSVSAQQVPKVYNQFFMNPYIYNPAFAGVEGHSVIFATYKKDWMNIDGAPTTYNANFHVPLKGGLSFGVMAYSEQTGAYQQSGGKVTAGYLISIDREHFFRFGMSLGAGTNSIDFDRVEPNDLAFLDLNNSSFLIGDVGMAYHFGHFNVGLALPKLFENEFYTAETSPEFSFKPQNHVLLKMNYRGHLGDDMAIEPHLLYRYNKHLPDQLEATVILHLLHIVWVGGGYRQDAGFVGLLGAKFMEKIGVGYAYQYGNPTTASLAGPSHEIHIGYHLGTRKEHAEHVSSFIKSHRKSAEQRAREAELERQKQLQALQRSRQAAQETDEDDLGSLLGGAKPVDETKKATNWNYEQENEPVVRINKFGEKERGIKFDRVNEKGEKEVVFSWLPPPPPGATEEVYEIANPDEEPLIRTKPDGTKEAGIKWVRTIDGGEKETLIIWDEILTESEAETIDHNPAVAKELKDAKIRITADPVAEEPAETEPEQAQEPVIQEPEPVEEKPAEAIEEPAEVIAEEKPQQETRDEEEAKGDVSLTDDFRTPEELVESDEHLEVRRGGHMLELPAGNYVVAGVFESFENAEDESDRLFQRGFHDTKVGFLTARGYYYVVIYQSDSLSKANSEKNRIRNRSGLSDVWVLKVNE